jgi:hypothetical protein
MGRNPMAAVLPKLKLIMTVQDHFKPVVKLAAVFCFISIFFVVPSFGGEKIMAPIALELKVEKVRKGVPAETTKSVYSWDGYIVHLVAYNKGPGPLILIKKYMLTTPTGFEICDLKSNKVFPGTNQHSGEGMPGPLAAAQFDTVNINPSESAVIDNLFIEHDDKNACWTAWSTHWGWTDFGYKRIKAKLRITGQYELDQMTQENFRQHNPGATNLFPNRVNSSPLILELK